MSEFGYWWASVDGREPEVVRVTSISFVDKVAFATGNECDIDLNMVRLIERVLPAGRAAAVVAKLQDAWNDQACPGPADDIAEAIEFLQGAETRA